MKLFSILFLFSAFLLSLSVNAEAKAHARKKSRLVINTTTKARIFIEGVLVGVSDEMMIIRPGLVKLSVRAKGYKPQFLTLKLKRGKIKRLQVSLAKKNPSRARFKQPKNEPLYSEWQVEGGERPKIGVASPPPRSYFQ